MEQISREIKIKRRWRREFVFLPTQNKRTLDLYIHTSAKNKENIEHDACKKEFEDFYVCMTTAINKRMGK